MKIPPYPKINNPGIKSEENIKLKSKILPDNNILKDEISFKNDQIFNLSIVEDTEQNKNQKMWVMESIFSACKCHNAILDRNSILEIENIADRIVENVINNEKVSVSITNLKSYDLTTYIHSIGVTVIAIGIGNAMKLDRKTLCRLGTSALLHDVGKVGVPIEIISKPGKLTAAEYNVIKSHPQLGAEYFADNDCISPDIIEGILTHHEKIDGSGYPSGLKGDEIPLFGKIIAVADVYEAVTGERPYRMPVSSVEAVTYIKAGAGISFDENIVEAFLKSAGKL